MPGINHRKPMLSLLLVSFSKNREFLPPDYCTDLAEHAPELFVARILPLIAVECARRPKDVESDNTRDHIWPYLVHSSEHYDFDESLQHGLIQALRYLAARNPIHCRALTEPFLGQASHTLGYFLLRGWSANPTAFADDIVSYLTASPLRLDIGYSVTSGTGGTGTAAISREAVKAAGPHCSSASFSKLESAIQRFRDPWEAQNPKIFGLTQFLLFSELPRERMSRSVLARFEEAARKFHEVDPSPPVGTQVFEVISPIKEDAAAKMSDEHWISAMRKYDHRRPRNFADYQKGGMHELSGTLIARACAEKKRFANLLLRLPEDIEPTYFQSILSGLGEVKTEGGNSGTAISLETPELAAAIYRVDRLPGRPSARTICSVINRNGKRNWPVHVIDIVIHHAMNDPDPEAEQWQDRGEQKGH